jgi:hypothetical protein
MGIPICSERTELCGTAVPGCVLLAASFNLKEEQTARAAAAEKRKIAKWD